MTQCSFLNSQCQSGIFESANTTCRLFNEPLEQLEDGNSEETTLFMKINTTGDKQITYIVYMHICCLRHTFGIVEK